MDGEGPASLEVHLHTNCEFAAWVMAVGKKEGVRGFGDSEERPNGTKQKRASDGATIKRSWGVSVL